MHELGVVFHVIRMVEEVAAENELTEISAVTLELGELSAVIESYLQNCWRWAVEKKSDIMHGCELIVETIPAVTLCEACGRTYSTVEHGKLCPHCGSERTVLLSGNEFNVKEIEGC